MKSLKWPEMFGANNKLKLNQDTEAIKTNLHLLFNCERKTLLGDQYFGTILKRLLYEQRNTILVDLLIDELYSVIQEYMPQIIIARDDITIRGIGAELYAIIRVKYSFDGTTDLYQISLTNNEQEG